MSKPNKSGWYVATPNKHYTDFLQRNYYIYPELILAHRRVFYFKPLHIWLNLGQSLYWFEEVTK